MLHVAAITFDFGNTLVPVDRAGLAAVVRETAEAVAARGLAGDSDAFLAAWEEERARQFREEVPRFREVSLPERTVRALARLRGMAAPSAHERWDDVAAGRLVEPTEVEAVVDAYSSAFVTRLPPAPDAGSVLERLAGGGFVLGILSNWPLGATIDRYVEARGWLRHLQAVVVSERVGTIKPHPAIFDHARELLGVAAKHILHVGDDWAADVEGARAAGWRAAYLRHRQSDTPLPTSSPPPDVVEAGDAASLGDDTVPVARIADLVVDELSDVVGRVALWRAPVR